VQARLYQRLGAWPVFALVRWYLRPCVTSGLIALTILTWPCWPAITAWHNLGALPDEYYATLRSTIDPAWPPGEREQRWRICQHPECFSVHPRGSSSRRGRKPC
jgi:hypothetical protein